MIVVKCRPCGSRDELPLVEVVTSAVVTDSSAAGNVQPTAKDLENKKSFLEDNSQFPRKIKI